MPEGDAVWRTARRLHSALAGQVLVGSDLRVPALATRDLSGRSTLEVISRGKHVLHRLEGGLTLHSHLRMDGSWRVLGLSTGARPGPNSSPTSATIGRHPAASGHTVRAVLWSGSVLAVGDNLGMLDLVETAREDLMVGHLGPDLLDRDFDRELALDNLLGRSEPGRTMPTIAEALLDQRNLAGIGTIYASEPLWEHRISPWRPANEVPRGLLGAVIDTARRWMVRSCRVDPRTARNPRTPNPPDGWLPGRYRVFGRRGLPCHRCGTTIAEGSIGHQPRERVISFCPTCQV